MDYKGVIIEESLEDKNLLNEVEILETKIEKVTPRHKTPYLKQWTLHTVKVSENQAENMAAKISKSFDRKHNDWYADYKNDKYHYIIYPDRIFKIDMSKPEEYSAASEYGISLGIPDYQVNFLPDGNM